MYDDEDADTLPERYATWNEYWTNERNQPWRIEPKIDKDIRGKWMSQLETVTPDIHRGIYPFKDVTLTRADVEWLLATHESGGMRGPVDWEQPAQRQRKGLDLRGAILKQVNLTGLPLARLQGGLSGSDFDAVSTDLETRETKLAWAAVNLDCAVLTDVRLQGSALVAAHMEGAQLMRAHLEAADMYGVHLASDTPADFSNCFMNEATAFRELHLANAHGIGPRLRRVHWSGAQLAGNDWENVKRLADENDAHARRLLGKNRDRRERIHDYGRAISANQLLATALRSQGFSEAADKFAYRTQRCQRVTWRLQRKYLRFLGSLGLDITSGYGYKPMRSFVTYALVVIGFAAAYFALGFAGGHPLTWNEAIVVSMTSFHGRGFFPAVFQPGDLPAAVAAVEAFIGLLIEIVLIATFTQRFFAR